MSFLSRVMTLKSRAHVSTGQRGRSVDSSFDGAVKMRSQLARNRLIIIVAGFVAVYGVVGARLVQYGMTPSETVSSIGPADQLMASRPDILDRNGEVLATDIRTVSLYAEPNKIVDPDEAVELLSTVLPDLDIKKTYEKLSSKTYFQWLRRQLTPKQQSQILSLGIPGIGFRPEKRRFYPGGPVAAHILGLVNIDNRGIAGMEKYIDGQGLGALAAAGLTSNAPLEPVRLSIDLRVQSILHDVLVDAKEGYEAIAAGGVVLNAKTGEVLAMASIPDFDPNNPYNALEKDRLNRMSAGVYEMGSTFKTFTIAMGLDSGLVKMSDMFDASKPLYIGGFAIHDYHNLGRALSVKDVFVHSSNVGSARMADVVGIDGHKEFLTRLGLLSRMDTELPEVATPTQPKVWKKINSMTIAFGHGVATTPLQTAVAGAAIMNGGKLIEPTFLPRTEAQADEVATQVLKPTTVANMRYLFRANAVLGSGKRANITGFDVGGKTGTADKVINGRYSSKHNFNAFLAAFPIDDPQYVVLTFIDDPKTGARGDNTAASTASPMVGEIIRRAAPLLGVQPKFGPDGEALLVSY
ncbi:peptidoglycan D,D-transpeptidase FtsI family protein [Rhizobium sp. NRK18]|uniref:peptidoglycan D,D-transpeptidase FtsI family protein n=1 Tax=Rhizobium sp. NRK18 TaxID=2964667 RepID=UPI0021C27FD5|nr:penicillin-binding protein 2 [Rhizobium sp. NRK18]MCQ2003750.1 penicillin-binding protein 2 [Rhizobium sp. NRK18]